MTGTERSSEAGQDARAASDERVLEVAAQAIWLASPSPTPSMSVCRSLARSALAAADRVVPLPATPDLDAPLSQSVEINALQHEFPDKRGWLSTLVWNLRNEYITWPAGKVEAASVRLLVEGFLAEIRALRAAAPVSLPAPKLADALRELLRVIPRESRGEINGVPLAPIEKARAALREYDAAESKNAGVGP